MAYSMRKNASNSEIILYNDVSKENAPPSIFKQNVMSGEDYEIDQSGFKM